MSEAVQQEEDEFAVDPVTDEEVAAMEDGPAPEGAKDDEPLEAGAAEAKEEAGAEEAPEQAAAAAGEAPHGGGPEPGAAAAAPTQEQLDALAAHDRDRDAEWQRKMDEMRDGMLTRINQLSQRGAQVPGEAAPAAPQQAQADEAPALRYTYDDQGERVIDPESQRERDEWLIGRVKQEVTPQPDPNAAIGETLDRFVMADPVGRSEARQVLESGFRELGNMVTAHMMTTGYQGGPLETAYQFMDYMEQTGLDKQFMERFPMAAHDTRSLEVLAHAAFGMNESTLGRAAKLFNDRKAYVTALAAAPQEAAPAPEAPLAGMQPRASKPRKALPAADAAAAPVVAGGEPVVDPPADKLTRFRELQQLSMDLDYVAKHPEIMAEYNRLSDELGEKLADE